MKLTYHILAGTFIALALTGCQNDSKKAVLLDKIDQQEQNYAEAISQGEETKNTVKPLLKLYEKYYQTFPQDTVAAKFLMKGGQTAMHSNMNKKAIRFFDAVETGFPKTSHYPMAIFMKAFVYDNIGDTSRARVYYEKFIDKYPNHKLSKDAKISIENLGKNLEEIVQQFDKRQKKER